MATGYTHEIADESFTFKDFLKSCSGAFHRESELSTYHSDRLKEINEDEIKFQKATAEELAKEYYDDKAKELEKLAERTAENIKLVARYKEFIAMAETLNVPDSTEHDNFIAFVKQQLVDSLDWDDRSVSQAAEKTRLENAKFNYGEHIRNSIKDFETDRAYHIREQALEEERFAQRTNWINKLNNLINQYD